MGVFLNIIFISLVGTYLLNPAVAADYCEILPTRSYNEYFHVAADYHFDPSIANIEDQLAAALRFKRNGNYYASFKALEALSFKSNNASVHFNLGQYYRQGIGVEKDFNFAASYYTHAGLLGSKKAQVNLGLLYYEASLKAYKLYSTSPQPMGKLELVEQALYWLLTAISMGDNNVKPLVEQIVDKPEYLKVYLENYPGFLPQDNPVLDHLSKFHFSVNGQFQILQSMVQARSKYQRKINEQLFDKLLELKCLLLRMKHFNRFGLNRYLFINRDKLVELVQEIELLAKNKRLKFKSKSVLEKFKHQMGGWHTISIPFIYIKLKEKVFMNNLR